MIEPVDLRWLRKLGKRRGADRRLLVPKSMNEMSWLAPDSEDSSLDCSKLSSVGIEMSFNQMLTR